MPVDDSGSWTLAAGSALPFHGPRELAELLASRTEARDAFAQEWAELAVGRSLDPQEPSVREVVDAFVAADLNILALIAAAAATDAFLAP
jgi:hypothetical protein